MKRKTLTLTAAATAIALVTAFAAAPSLAHGPQGTTDQTESGQMGSGMMGGKGAGHMGGGMMGGKGAGHMGGGMMGGMMGHQQGDRNLSVDDVRKVLDGMIVMHGNDRLKVGKIEATDDKTIVAEIVTVDDSLVQKIEFDTKTGAHHPVK
ncbi:MAG: hypothetical protein ACTSV1_03515 [Alphaproteobacteria bacterium]